MRRIVVEEFGGPEQLVMREAALPQPSPGQVRIRNTLTSVNYADVQARRGGYDAGRTPPFTPGLDCTGVVEKVGEGVTTLRAGQRVAAWTIAGSYAEQVVADARLTYALPDSVADSEGAALTVLVTAFNALTARGRLEPGESVLIHAAGGGVGSAAVQLAVVLGAGRVIATASTAAKCAAARGYGATDAFSPGSDDLAQRVLELTSGAGVDVIIDTVGGALTEQGLACLAPFGRLVTCGHAGGTAATLRSTDLHRTNRSVLGYSTGHQRTHRPDALAPAVAAVYAHAAAGEVSVPSGVVLPLAEAPRAHALAESRSVVGRILLAP
jgi:NADPH2:quinone reductase